MFKVLDAHRVSKRGMEELMNAEKIDEYIANYAVYRIDINWLLLWQADIFRLLTTKEYNKNILERN